MSTQRVRRPSDNLWGPVASTMARELGVPYIGKSTEYGVFQQVVDFLLASDTSGALDVIELAFLIIDSTEFRHDLARRSDSYEIDPVIEELNHRFQEHSIGYQFVEGQLIKVDSQYVHAEVVEPALHLLHDEGFAGAEDEFLRAHEHYRHGRYKESLNEALKAFESTMKTICETREWEHDRNAPAAKLIATLFEHELLPQEMTSYFAGVRSVLESGLPTLRNRRSGHGQGKDTVIIPEHIAAFALHLAAANILLLVEAHRAKEA